FAAPPYPRQFTVLLLLSSRSPIALPPFRPRDNPALPLSPHHHRGITRLAARGQEASLCDDYSIPVDFVNKRPLSIAVGLTNWTTPSPSGERIEVLETYCDPRDSKAYLRPGDEPSGAKLYTSPDRDYSQPYPVGPPLPLLPHEEAAVGGQASQGCSQVDDLAASLAAAWARKFAAPASTSTPYESLGGSASSSPGERSEGEPGEGDERVGGEGRGSSGGEAGRSRVAPRVPRVLPPVGLSPTRGACPPAQGPRHPSPYYYADLFKERQERTEEQEFQPSPSREEAEEGEREGREERKGEKEGHQHHHHQHHHHHHHHHHKHSRHHHHHHRQHRHHHHRPKHHRRKAKEGEGCQRRFTCGPECTSHHRGQCSHHHSTGADPDLGEAGFEGAREASSEEEGVADEGSRDAEDAPRDFLSGSRAAGGGGAAALGPSSPGAEVAHGVCTCLRGSVAPEVPGGQGGPEGGGGAVGGGPAPPAFLAACILRHWDLVFATPAEAAARHSAAAPGGPRGVAKGLRASCSCRPGAAAARQGTPSSLGEELEEGAEGEEEEDGEEMSGRQRHLYETAFDCKVRRSQDDLDEVDRVSNHPVLRMLPATLSRATSTSSPKSIRSSVPAREVSTPPPSSSREKRRSGKGVLDVGESPVRRPSPAPSTTALDPTNFPHGPDDPKLKDRHPVFQTPPSAKGPLGVGGAPSPPPLRGYAPSPPSTAPLPAKFHNTRELLQMNSAPDLPAKGMLQGASPERSRDPRLPIKACSSSRRGPDGPILEFKGRPGAEDESGRYEADVIAAGEGTVINVGRGHKHREVVVRSSGARPKYSSTESMATSSSAMSSLESLRSSTSEGNRSTSSSGSRRSSSLSSHSSDSGSARLLDLHRLHLHHYHHHHLYHHHQLASQSAGLQSGQLHILSPISDKSQEPASETSDNNRNNNSSQGASPEERLCSEGVVAVDNIPANTVTSTTSEASVQQATVAASSAKANTTPPDPVHLRQSPTRQEPPTSSSVQTLLAPTPWESAPKLKRRVLVLQNKNLLNRALVQAAAAAAAAATSSSGEAEVQGSDSGISVESSSRGGQSIGQSGGSESTVPTTGQLDLRGLPFDMPKLRRRLTADASGSSSTSVASSSRPEDLRALPFDMPKLRRRLRLQQSGDDGPEPDASSGVSQASSSQSVLELDAHPRNAVGQTLLLGPPVIQQPQIVRPKLTLDLCDPNPWGSSLGPPSSSAHLSRKKRPGLSLELGCSALSASGEPVDVTIPLERQGWYHGAITRVEAESILRLRKEGSYLVRNSESTRQDYSLSLKSARGFMHMRIQQDKESGRFVLGQFSQPFCSIPDMIQFYSANRLPIKGAEHMCLLHPVIEQLL
ncbi:uncharacterized protein hwt, partial [Hetaerina americana]|uniref:uncharacterized protein hwt n=1 Tax=Hetaerina americana TaxID=62018 RepID=UPI003A7F200C